MSKLIKGQDRSQGTLFPERLDDYVEEDSSVRVIDVFIDDLDISGLGFRTVLAATGRPRYHPKTMLKLYVYGYLNRVQSSRRLEVEAQRNIELMWLTGRLAPDFKTIADFRKDNPEAIRLVCREFVMLCKKMKRRLRDVESAIERYLARLDETDQTEPKPDDARSMNSRGTGVVGYNVQSAVDAKHHLIVAHEVSKVGSDRRQLAKMAKQASEVLEPKTSPNKAKGQFDRSRFRYIKEDDEYECPAGERLTYRFRRSDYRG